MYLFCKNHLHYKNPITSFNFLIELKKNTETSSSQLSTTGLP
jgi:hypothetical protein